MKVGDLIWQSRLPGGVCVYLGEVTKETTKHTKHIWAEVDEPVLLVLHPSEGLIEDPSYYYMTLEDEERYCRRRVAYELKKASRTVPDWLQKEIAEDENR